MNTNLFDAIPKATEEIVAKVVDAALRVHRELGPGLLESVYEVCLCHELSKAGISFQCQLELPVTYDGVRLETGLRIDVIAAECVLVEVKAVERLLPVHEAQILTYLKLTGIRVGLLINFNVPLIKDGIKRYVR